MTDDPDDLDVIDAEADAVSDEHIEGRLQALLADPPERAMEIGDRVTVEPGDQVEIEIGLHAHAVIVAIEPGPAYVVAHPPVPRRFGPYPEERLTPGWVDHR